MTNIDKMFYCRTALVLRLIELKQCNHVMEIWHEDMTRDTGEILLECGYLTEAGLREIDKAVRVKEEKSYDERGIIGRGGTGRVYLGFDRNIEREIAVKELDIESKERGYAKILARFVREAKITGQLEHPGIVPIYEFGVRRDGKVYYAMKYVRGKTLHKAIKECEDSSPETAFAKRMKLLGALIDVCEAMSFAHTSNVIHRDLKPGNIVLGKFGETVLLDWGLAKKTGNGESMLGMEEHLKWNESEIPENPELTSQGQLLGTLSYMSPEQAAGDNEKIDQRSDVYSLGAILFVILTGKKPYAGERRKIFEFIKSDLPVPSPKKLLSIVPAELAVICEKAMKKDKNERYSNAGEMAEDLKAYRDGRLVSVYAYTRKEIFKRFVHRNKVSIGAAFAVLLAILVGAGFSVNFGIDAHRARKQAENALVDVTLLSQSGVDLSRKMVSELETYFDKLSSEMAIVAAEISNKNIDNQSAINIYLKGLHQKYPQIKAFETINALGKITAVYPVFDKMTVGLDISGQDIIKWSFKNKKPVFSQAFKTVEGFNAVTLQVPIIKNKKMVGILSALMDTGKMIPSILSIDPLESTYNIWVMQEDGYILYDEDSREIGTSLFREDVYIKYPELAEFGKEMLKEEWGVGTYKFLDQGGNKEVHKVSVWNTFTPTSVIYSYGSKRAPGIEGFWKVVASHPYTTKK